VGFQLLRKMGGSFEANLGKRGEGPSPRRPLPKRKGPDFRGVPKEHLAIQGGRRGPPETRMATLTSLLLTWFLAP